MIVRQGGFVHGISRASAALVIVGDFDAIPGIVARTRERLTILGALRGEGVSIVETQSEMEYVAF